MSTPTSAAPTRSPIDCADWQALPLQGPGCGLVEASAGTGKTWTLTALYLRLLLECEYSPRQIAVATFTNAAADDLRARIRARLREARALAQDFSASTPVPEDAALAWLHRHWSQQGGAARTQDAERLQRAVGELDSAPLGTLHSLFGRALAEHPLDSGSSFATDEAVDGKDLDDTLREDLWRHLAQDDAATLDGGDRLWYAGGRKNFNEACRVACTAGYGVQEIPLDADVFAALKDPSQAKAIRDWLPTAPFFRADSAIKPGMVALADYIDAGDPFAPFPSDMKKLLSNPLDKQFKAGTTEVQGTHPLVRLAKHALLAHPHARARALARYRERLLAARRQRLRERGQTTFDALIERTLDAVEGPSGEAFAQRLREDWPVALIDEFQDTDGRQFRILARIYGSNADGATAHGRLVMIGDPKQAIYSFRGGDVHAYLAARQSASHRLRLTRNFRSTPHLVQALNQWFALSGHAMSQQPAAPIVYEPVQADDSPSRTTLTVDGQPLARPLQFEVLAPSDTTAKEAAQAALIHCANQIARLLDEGRHRIDDKRVQPGDIAVLVPKNDDITSLRELLSERGIPCAAPGRSSVFATAVARDLQCILHGVEHAGDEALVRAALATDLLGGLDFVRGLRDRPDDWRTQMQRFAHWRRLWHTQGVFALVQALLATRATPRSPDEQRRYTDLRHLGELLQAHAAQCDGPQALLAWLASQREGGSGDGAVGEERELRIDSDAHRVQVMSLHAAKGLEFPIVYLPLADVGAIKQSSLPTQRTPDGQRLIDLGGTEFEAAQTATLCEEQDESFRKLYVALTRAQYACHVLVSNPKSKAVDPQRLAMTALLARMRTTLDGRRVEDACPHVAWIEHAVWPTEYCTYHVPTQPTSTPVLLELPRAHPLEGRYSFSNLTDHATGTLEETAASDEAVNDAIDPEAAVPDVVDADVADAAVVDADVADDAVVDTAMQSAVTQADATPHATLATLDAWRGANFGSALHAVFERRRIGVPMSEQRALLETCLGEYGIAAKPEQVDTLAAHVQDVLDATLPVAGSPPLRLADLPAHALRAEMRFDYALDGASMARLRALCAAHGQPDLVPERRHPDLHGMMGGAIDLIFLHAGRYHLLDWKTNRLGERLSDYTGAALVKAMDRSHYRLQALLYTIALDRYLRQRVHGYDRTTHLGAAVYLFVRAVGLHATPAVHAQASGVAIAAPGVWTQRFDDDLIAAVDAELALSMREVA
ncbi:MAG: UvrD-helicase domain-containing protein [Proteobacteria bacterium]|nr:UvrD-helicase domain-containing protein [Pseudomonadota bacterium]